MPYLSVLEQYCTVRYLRIKPSADLLTESRTTRLLLSQCDGSFRILPLLSEKSRSIRSYSNVMVRHPIMTVGVKHVQTHWKGESAVPLHGCAVSAAAARWSGSAGARLETDFGPKAHA